jgi:hypothetical protein
MGKHRGLLALAADRRQKVPTSPIICALILAAAGINTPELWWPYVIVSEVFTVIWFISDARRNAKWRKNHIVFVAVVRTSSGSTGYDTMSPTHECNPKSIAGSYTQTSNVTGEETAYHDHQHISVTADIDVTNGHIKPTCDSFTKSHPHAMTNVSSTVVD